MLSFAKCNRLVARVESYKGSFSLLADPRNKSSLPTTLFLNHKSHPQMTLKSEQKTRPTYYDELRERGYSRRDFMKFCTFMAAYLGL